MCMCVFVLFFPPPNSHWGAGGGGGWVRGSWWAGGGVLVIKKKKKRQALLRVDSSIEAVRVCSYMCGGRTAGCVDTHFCSISSIKAAACRGGSSGGCSIIISQGRAGHRGHARGMWSDRGAASLPCIRPPHPPPLLLSPSEGVKADERRRVSASFAGRQQCADRLVTTQADASLQPPRFPKWSAPPRPWVWSSCASPCSFCRSSAMCPWEKTASSPPPNTTWEARGSCSTRAFGEWTFVVLKWNNARCGLTKMR